MKLSKAQDRELREGGIGHGFIVFKASDDTTCTTEFYTDRNGVVRFVGNGKPLQLTIEHDEDGEVSRADVTTNIDTEVLDRLIVELKAKNRELINRALKAETEWSTFRHLTEQAREIIERDHQINERSVEAVEAPPSVKRFIQRSHDALKRAAPD